MFKITILLGMLTSAIQAVDLPLATNQQILDELSRRLNGGGGGGGAPLATASYTCSWQGNINISTSGTGTTGNSSLNTGNYQNCEEQAKVLNTFKSKIYGSTIAAACDWSGNLYRYRLETNGYLTNIDSQNTGNYQNCFSQMKMLNGA